MHVILAPSYNQPKFYPSATWHPNALTFATNNTVGSGPFGIFVNLKDTIYVPNGDTGQIHIWIGDSINPTRTIYGNWSNPSSIFVTNNDDIYIDNGDMKNRVVKSVTHPRGGLGGLVPP
jgi:hypothetical protein